MHREFAIPFNEVLTPRNMQNLEYAVTEQLKCGNMVVVVLRRSLKDVLKVPVGGTSLQKQMHFIKHQLHDAIAPIRGLVLSIENKDERRIKVE